MREPAHTRTCVGCGRRASRDQLIRFVARGEAVILDPDRCAPGRGAWLCPALRCFDRAEKRRAFGRTLRLELKRASVTIDGTQREMLERLIGEDTSGEGPSL